MSAKRRSRRRQLNVSHQRNWLVGRHAVLETLRAARWPVRHLYVSPRLEQAAAAELQALASTASVPVETVDDERLTELCHAHHHQGVAARMAEFPCETEAWLLQKLNQPAAQPHLVILCDRIQDAFNFGAILRSADAAAATAVVIAPHGQAAVTPQVARSSAGAVNHVPIVVCDDLLSLIPRLRTQKLVIAAASEKATEDVWETRIDQPIALIIGNEAHGVAAELLAECDTLLRIPMMGSVDSLNAAVAAGILMFELRRQQREPPAKPAD